MRKYGALYEWPIQAVAHLTNAEAEEFEATLETDTKKEEFTRITEQIRGIGVDLHGAQAGRTLASNWLDLKALLSDLSTNFAEYSPNSVMLLVIFSLLAEKLTRILDHDRIDEVLAEELVENMFELRPINSSPPFDWYVHENSVDTGESLVVLSGKKLIAIERENLDESRLMTTNISPDLLFYLLAQIVQVDEITTSHLALTKRLPADTDSSVIDSFARLMMLATGNSVDERREYSRPPSILNIDSFRVGNLFQQWSELFQVLSDYNSIQDLLLKYLMLYHVIENLVFKYPIVELERQNSGNMFSIRDFRRLYKKVDQNEADALKKMFADVIGLEAIPASGGNPAQTFREHIVSRWRSLGGLVPEGEIESALKKLGVGGNASMKYADFKNDNQMPNYYSQMVYTFRCAIVHNKETELHLTHAGLTEAYSVLLEEFLIPSLEELCYALIGVPNNKVWYENRHMALY